MVPEPGRVKVLVLGQGTGPLRVPRVGDPLISAWIFSLSVSQNHVAPGPVPVRGPEVGVP